jgi:hypothetical protein
MTRYEPSFSRDEDEDEDDDPNDPSHRDYDLSESAPYASYEEQTRPWFTRRWVLLIVAVLIIASLLLPYLDDLF